MQLLLDALYEKGYEKSDYYIVQLNKNYYAVTYEDNKHNICFGKDDVWHWDPTTNTLIHTPYSNFKMPYFNENATKKLRTNFTMKIYSDLLTTYQTIRIKKFKNIDDNRPFSIAPGSAIYLHYAKVLARTFMDRAFTKNDVQAIKSYILMNNADKVTKSLFVRHPDMKSFNPFILTATLNNKENYKVGCIFASNGELLDYKLLK